MYPPLSAPWRSYARREARAKENMMPYYDCNHDFLFIGSERGPDARRASAYVCTRCGTFRVWINGELMTFWLVSDAQVAAAGMYARELARTGMEPQP